MSLLSTGHQAGGHKGGPGGPICCSAHSICGIFCTSLEGRLTLQSNPDGAASWEASWAQAPLPCHSPAYLLGGVRAWRSFRLASRASPGLAGSGTAAAAFATGGGAGGAAAGFFTVLSLEKRSKDSGRAGQQAERSGLPPRLVCSVGRPE